MLDHMETGNEPDSERLRLVKRTLAMLEALAMRPVGATPKELSQALGLHLSTCYRLLNSLVAAGYVVRCEGGGLFRIGPRVAFLHRGFLETVSPPADAIPFLHALQLATGETAMLAQLIGDDLVIVASVEGVRPDAYPPAYPGLSALAHSFAAGKALLAWLPTAQREAYLSRHAKPSPSPFPIAETDAVRAELEQIRARGYAIDRGQGIRPEVCCVAAPIGEATQKVSTAISVVAPCARFIPEEPSLVSAVLAVSRAIGALRSGRAAENGRADAPAAPASNSRLAIEAAQAAIEATMSRVT